MEHIQNIVKGAIAKLRTKLQARGTTLADCTRRVEYDTCVDSGATGGETSAMTFLGLRGITLLALFATLLATTASRAGDTKAPALLFQSIHGADSWTNGLQIRPFLVDGKTRESWFGKPIKVPPGEHAIGVGVSFELKPKNPLFEAMPKYGDIFYFTFTLAPGRSYIATGSQQGTFVKIWIEDKQTKDVVTDVIDIEVFPCKKIFERCPPAKINRSSGMY